MDLDRIRKNDGYVYVWTLSDYTKPTETGTLSIKQYRDCRPNIEKEVIMKLPNVYVVRPFGTNCYCVNYGITASISTPEHCH